MKARCQLLVMLIVSSSIGSYSPWIKVVPIVSVNVAKHFHEKMVMPGVAPVVSISFPTHHVKRLDCFVFVLSVDVSMLAVVTKLVTVLYDAIRLPSLSVARPS